MLPGIPTHRYIIHPGPGKRRRARAYNNIRGDSYPIPAHQYVHDDKLIVWDIQPWLRLYGGCAVVLICTCLQTCTFLGAHTFIRGHVQYNNKMLNRGYVPEAAGNIAMTHFISPASDGDQKSTTGEP